MTSATRPPRRTPSVAAGAARAAGERARRHATPLLGAQPEIAGESQPATGESAPTRPASGTGDASTPRATRPRRRSTAATTSRSAGSSADPGAGQSGAATGSAYPVGAHPVGTNPVGTNPVGTNAVGTNPGGSIPAGAHPAGRRAEARPERPRLQIVRDGHIPQQPNPMPALTEIAEAVTGAVSWLCGRFGIPTAEAEARVAEAIAFIRRRIDGEFTVDDFGFDADYAEHVLYPLLRPLQHSWFRTEVRGIDAIPAEGGALLVANHSGTIALDALITQVAIHDAHPRHRHLRGLGADLVFSTPFVGEAARRGGATLATAADAERLLSRGELVGVWPEGFKGTGKPFRERYRLQRFGRGGFVSTAVKAGVPIIPCAIVGAEETYPLLANVKPLARVLGLPYVPITPTFPWLGPLGLIPLPSKWMIEFSAPIETASLGAASADDPAVVFDLTDRVRETIQQTIYSLLVRRRSPFH